MASVITIAGEQLFAAKAQANEQLDIDTFIFANVPNQDPSAPINREEGIPTAHIVYQQNVQQVGRINDNVVVYSTVLDSITGPFEFNWVGLYSSVNQKLVAINHVPTVTKTATAPGAAGNTLNRNFGIEYSGIAELTGISVEPETWQLDFTARLSGMDKLTQQLAADMNGKDWFIDDGLKVVPRATANSFSVTPGVGYVSGLRVELKQEHILIVQSYPQFVYVDAWFSGNANSTWSPQLAFTVTNTEMDDYIDPSGTQHYVYKLAVINAADDVEDLRGNLGISKTVSVHLGNNDGAHDSIYSKTFSSVADMKADDAFKAKDIDLRDLAAKTISYYGGWAAQMVPFGGAEYIITTLNRVRETLKSSTWVPDGYGSHYILGGTNYVAKIRSNGYINVDAYGAKPNDATYDSSQNIYAAAVAARDINNGINLGNNNINPRAYVQFTSGVTYYTYTTIALDTEAVRIDFRCEGLCNISGANPLTPTTRTELGFSFNRVYRTTFKGFNFCGFRKIHEWDTDNADQCTVVYDNCDFFDCGVPGVPVIDTKSFSDSRSTDLSFINCRCSFVPMLLNCYCDTLRFEGGIYRNYDENGCLVQADSLVTVIGGMWVPTRYGDNARWFDLYDNGTTGTRGLNAYGVRFSPEAGGITVVYNYMSGQNSATNHLTSFISFHGGTASASSGVYDGGLVVLMDDGVNSYAPGFIGFYGASVRSGQRLVRTKNAKPVGKVRGIFSIEVSGASQSHLTDINTPVNMPVVENILRQYLVGDELYNEAVVLGGGGNMIIDLSTINAGPRPIIQINGENSRVDAISNAFDGQEVFIEFLSDNCHVTDNSNGSRMYLDGSADITTNAYGTVTLVWNRVGNKWFEKGRSIRN
ncbi:phage tail protein [Shewanella algae]|uniref:phage tail-collar fiber domain-containing protein n=1 Tax=Shewanella algae TaxID=38313 RepID=UPI0031F4B94A